MRIPRAALVALLLLSACDREEPEATAVRGAEATESIVSGQATRRTIAGCEYAEAALRYEPFVEERARVKLLWNDMPENAAELELELGIKGIGSEGIWVHVPEIPLREHYVALWIASGHLHLEGTELALDPCSAELISGSSG